MEVMGVTIAYVLPPEQESHLPAEAAAGAVVEHERRRRQDCAAAAVRKTLRRPLQCRGAHLLHYLRRHRGGQLAQRGEAPLQLGADQLLF